MTDRPNYVDVLYDMGDAELIPRLSCKGCGEKVVALRVSE